MIVTSPRLAIYIDGANIDIASKAVGIKIDYRKFKTFFVGNRRIAVANYYNSNSSDPAERAFYSSVEKAGFQLVLGTLKISGRQQKEIDVQIAVDMISGTYAGVFDVALLVTGDGDLAPAVRKMVSMHKVVEAASFNDPARREFAWSLKTAASKTIDLTRNMDKFRM